MFRDKQGLTETIKCNDQVCTSIEDKTGYDLSVDFLKRCLLNIDNGYSDRRQLEKREKEKEEKVGLDMMDVEDEVDPES